MRVGGLEPPPDDEVEFSRNDPVLATPFRVGEVASAVLAAQGAAAARIWQMRGNPSQQIRVDARAAALATFCVAFQKLNGYAVSMVEPDFPTVGLYPTCDNRFICINGGYPLLRRGLLELLNCFNSKDSIGAAIAKWNATELEEAIAARKLIGGVARTRDEWLAHPQGSAIANTPLVEIVKIGESKPEPFGPADRPLSGIRVLDLTHVIAGPTCGKSLAAHGAEVLHIYSPTRPQFPPFDIDTSHGKAEAFLDLKQDTDKQRLRELLDSADVMSDSYRPGRIGNLGFSPLAVAERRPGIIVVSVNCYGFAGPWQYRGGFEQIAQSVTGMTIEQGMADHPQLAPTFPNDYVTGFLAAFGALAALIRRAQEGGSYHVRVSLSRTAMWLQDQGRVKEDWKKIKPLPTDCRDVDEFFGSPDGAFSQKYFRKFQTAMGELTFLGPVLEMSGTPMRWERRITPLGSGKPEWGTPFPAV